MLSDSLEIFESISCSWASSIPKGLVKFGVNSDKKEWDEDGGIVHVISDENFVFLKKVDDLPCTICIKLSDSSIQITNISVVSEARIIEIYGKYGEYIKTCKCEHISEANGINFYGAQTDLLTTKEITVKFPGVKKRNMVMRCKDSSAECLAIYYELV
uniref:Unkown protein n=1 Tax=Riptortus pedestris TaxID=329032 RepID=R4WE70_RIPPE|nr:unkown protein [Riptortus pedestris]